MATVYGFCKPYRKEPLLTEYGAFSCPLKKEESDGVIHCYATNMPCEEVGRLREIAKRPSNLEILSQLKEQPSQRTRKQA